MALPDSSLASQPSMVNSFTEHLTMVQSPIQEKPDLAKKSLHGQALWENSMKEIDLTRRYRKVSVMIIHWEHEENVDLAAAQDEIERLRHVFESKYNFNVRETILGRDKKGRSPQAHIQKELANFVWDEDEDQTLLIVYGAGHGIPVNETGKFLLAGDATEIASDRFNSIVWQEAEALMRPAARADIFLILDCCHAGRLLTMRARTQWSERIFEFLGACSPNQTTPLPGKKSFTSALIWALEQLADAGKPFFSSELREKISRYKHLHKDQLPCWDDRGIHSLRRLILEPLPEAVEEEGLKEDFPSSTTTQKAAEPAEFKYALKLHFLLPELPNDEEVDRLCGSLKYLITSREIPAKQIQWKGLFKLEDLSPEVELARVVDRLATKWQNKALKEKIKKFSQHSIDTSGLTLIGSQLQTNGLLTPAPSEITLDEGDETRFNRFEPSSVHSEPDRRLAHATSRTPRSQPANVRNQMERRSLQRVVAFAFLLFFTVAVCLCVILLLDIELLVANLLQLAKNKSRWTLSPPAWLA